MLELLVLFRLLLMTHWLEFRLFTFEFVEDGLVTLRVELSLENAFSRYSKLGGVTGVLDGAHIFEFKKFFYSCREIP
jgi:hypothetical protein